MRIYAVLVTFALFRLAMQSPNDTLRHETNLKMLRFASGWKPENFHIISNKCQKQVAYLMGEMENNAPWAMRSKYASFPNDTKNGRIRNCGNETKERSEPCESDVGNSFQYGLFPPRIPVIEASSKYPTGVLSGNDYQLGDYDLCINTTSDSRSVRGKYCLADIHISLKEYPGFHTSRDFDLSRDPYASFLDKFKTFKDPSQKPRNVLHYGICVPEVCSSEDVGIGLKSLINEMTNNYGYNVAVMVSEDSCATGDKKGNDGARKIFWGIIIVMTHLVLLSTMWDLRRPEVKEDEQSLFPALAESFSVRKNVAKLMSWNPNAEFDSFHGMKTMSMILIILGHRCMASFGGPVYNAEFLEKGYRSFSTILLLNGILIVDTFFLIGGFLTFIALHREITKGRKIKTLQICLHRWLRITPEYMLVVFFYGYVLEYMGNGPVWSARVGREAEKCRDNWWTNFLYVNNYVNSNRLEIRFNIRPQGRDLP